MSPKPMRAAGSVNQHGWRDCRPSIVTLAGASEHEVMVSGIAEAQLVAWFLQQPDHIRAGQHNFGCWNRHTADNWAATTVVTNMARQIIQEVEKTVAATRPDHR